LLNQVLIPLNIRNKNNRIYTYNELKDKVNSEYYGQIGFDDNTEISLSNISHQVLNIRFENNKLIGDVKILNTEKGKILNNLIKSGIEYVFRPRSLGSISEDGYAKIDMIVSFDAILLKEDTFFSLKNERKKKLEKLSKIW